MERMAYIKLSSKCTLVLPERVLWEHLPADELEAAIKRGKAFKRAMACQKRQERQIGKGPANAEDLARDLKRAINNIR